MEPTPQVIAPPPKKSGLTAGKMFAIVLAAMLISIAVVLLVLKSWLFPSPFVPVALSATEKQHLEQKLDRLEQGTMSTRQPTRHWPEQPSSDDLKPEPYSEEGASHEIRLTEREINGLIAQNSDLAQRMVIDLAPDLVSAKLLIPVDPDFPIMGGKILKVRAGATLAFRQGRPVVILKGVSIMGVPLPNAWLGGLKNIDLVQTFGMDPGFWKSFADGISDIKVDDGSLRIVLHE